MSLVEDAPVTAVPVDEEELARAFHYFANRQRRFGLTSDQVAGG